MLANLTLNSEKMQIRLHFFRKYLIYNVKFDIFSALSEVESEKIQLVPICYQKVVTCTLNFNKLQRWGSA